MRKNVPSYVAVTVQCFDALDKHVIKWCTCSSCSCDSAHPPLVHIIKLNVITGLSLLLTLIFALNYNLCQKLLERPFKDG